MEPSLVIPVLVIDRLTVMRTSMETFPFSAADVTEFGAAVTAVS
jgi:hypothetical protein